jgi:hypothetical protein
MGEIAHLVLGDAAEVGEARVRRRLAAADRLGLHGEVLLERLGQRAAAAARQAPLPLLDAREPAHVEQRVRARAELACPLARAHGAERAALALAQARGLAHALLVRVRVRVRVEVRVRVRANPNPNPNHALLLGRQARHRVGEQARVRRAGRVVGEDAREAEHQVVVRRLTGEGHVDPGEELLHLRVSLEVVRL